MFYFILLFLLDIAPMLILIINTNAYFYHTNKKRLFLNGRFYLNYFYLMFFTIYSLDKLPNI